MLDTSSLVRHHSVARHRVSSTKVLMVIAAFTGLLAVGAAALAFAMGFFA